MLNVTKKLKLFVLYTELLSMIWLRLFIAVIALTISSDLSAWAQPQMQANSPEGFYDCKGVANGTNKRDIIGGCCLPSQQTFEHYCSKCNYRKIGCEPQFGCNTPVTKDRRGTCCPDNQKVCNQCGYAMQGCESDSRFGCNTTARKDMNGSCCFDSQKVCDKCNYAKQGCESDSRFGCNTTARKDMNGSCCFDSQKVCGKCNYKKQGCESISGCGNIAKVARTPVGCPTTRCRQVPSNNNGWPMKHSHYSGCPGDFPTTQPGGGPLNFGHGQTFYYVTLSANTRVTQPCYGRTDPKTCSDPGKSGWIYATNLAGERITHAEAGTAQWRICDNGVIKAGTTLSPPLMYCRPQ